MKELMRNYYYSPLKQAEHMVKTGSMEKKVSYRGRYGVNIRIKPGPIYFEPRFEFYDFLMGKHERFFLLQGVVCFGGDGRVHESAPP